MSLISLLFSVVICVLLSVVLEGEENLLIIQVGVIAIFKNTNKIRKHDLSVISIALGATSFSFSNCTKNRHKIENDFKLWNK